MADDLPHYRAWLLKQPCAVNAIEPCVLSVVVHHHTEGETHAPGARPEKALGGKRGKSQKASDYYGIPLCHRHHGQFHDAKGFCKDWDKENRSAWQTDQVLIHRLGYEAGLEMRGSGDDYEAPLSASDFGPRVPPSPVAEILARLPMSPTSPEGERRAILELLERFAASRHLTPDQVAACDEIRVLIEARGERKVAVF
jgi:hypothetical protein